MSPQTIIADNLSKTYQVPEREGGFGAAVGSFFKRKYKDVKAVQGVNFTISQGEIVGFLGPNGAGKTTTLKMLSGLLHPTGGNANVLGFTPWELKPEYLRSMTLVMGQRNRLHGISPRRIHFCSIRRSIVSLMMNTRLLIKNWMNYLNLSH